MKPKYFEVIKENIVGEKKKFKNLQEIRYRERYRIQSSIQQPITKKATSKRKYLRSKKS